MIKETGVGRHTGSAGADSLPTYSPTPLALCSAMGGFYPPPKRAIFNLSPPPRQFVFSKGRPFLTLLRKLISKGGGSFPFSERETLSNPPFSMSQFLKVGRSHGFLGGGGGIFNTSTSNGVISRIPSSILMTVSRFPLPNG